MAWLILALLIYGILEIVDLYLPIGLAQKLFSYLLIVLIGADSLVILAIKPAIWSALLFYVSVFRVFNLFKLIDSKKEINFLRSSYLRSSIYLISFQLVILALTYLAIISVISYQGKWTTVIAIELITSAVIVMSLRRALSKTRPKLKEACMEDKNLPSLTVAIPARNETIDLEDCLMSLIESDYPKLEILVLDDCSQEKRTPEIIRQFAHDGVRFLQGKVPDEDVWTAKNYAYQQLYEEANGKIILFCGVDIRFERHSLRRMVGRLIERNKSMISYMPLNELPKNSFKRLLIQPVRYLWELGLPRRFLNKPPALSSCWLIDREELHKGGGFKAVSRSIVPERYFARMAANLHDGYSFVALGAELGITSKKSFGEQRETGIRTRYPLLKQRLENVCALALLEAVVFVLPIGVLVYELIVASWLLSGLSALNVLAISLVFFVISRLTYGRSLSLSLIAYPLVFIYDLALTIYSMWSYEFNEIIWKGRNVCIPVMRQTYSPSEVAASNPVLKS